ncbi:MAG: hypothetical protein JWL82_20 [Parcubacteria group bacterium]|nr:hypothetical protein [Parcubacteria group bacterium]
MANPHKQQAIAFRREGKSYREIRALLPVAKSTLSEWFKSVELAVPQKQRMTTLRREAALRGAHARRDTRLLQIQKLNEDGKRDIGKLTDRELWLIGTALHWAEGSKQNMRSPSAGIMFGNSDHRMLSVFLAWLHSQGIERKDIFVELYIHIERRKDTEKFKTWWSEKLDISIENLDRVYYKKGNPKTNRGNVTDLYHGLLRIKVRSSTTLNRQVNGWIEGIVASLGDRLMVGQTPLKR